MSGKAQPILVGAGMEVVLLLRAYGVDGRGCRTGVIILIVVAACGDKGLHKAADDLVVGAINCACRRLPDAVLKGKVDRLALTAPLSNAVPGQVKVGRRLGPNGSAEGQDTGYGCNDVKN